MRANELHAACQVKNSFSTGWFEKQLPKNGGGDFIVISSIKVHAHA